MSLFSACLTFGTAVALMGDQEVSNFMIKRVLFSFMLMATVFACAGLANVPQYRLKLKINAPFLLETGSPVAVPPGEYYVKDMGTATGHLLSLERGRDHRHLAFMNTVRIDRARISWNDEPTVRFDYESSDLPVIKDIYLPGRDGFEILSVVYNKDSKYFVDVASLSKTKFTITTTAIESTAVETAPEPEPEPEAEPPAKEEPAVEAPPQEPAVEQPREEPQPVQPVEPIRERQRVRKD
jgi:hypothetical protein